MINFKKKLIVIKEKKNDNNTATIINKENSKLLDCIKLFNPKKEIAAKVGIDNKNDILAASYLLNFRILAPVIVIPALLTPGIKEMI